MKETLNIYNNFISPNFFYQIFSSYKINLKKIKDIYNDKGNNKSGIIFYKEDTKNKIDLKKISEHFLIFIYCNSNYISEDKNIIYLSRPKTVHTYKSHIKKFLLGQVKIFGDIKLQNSQIMNSKVNLSTNLTELENQILLYLIKVQECNKEIIKERILKIKSEVETNSLESHLTRIRKKIDKIKSKVKIRSKNDLLYIFFNQKK